jgi:cysteinyl-tRNA synthetase
VVVDQNKRDPRDFALWKKDEKHLMQWFSPWGWGFPGWHLECSVMANAYLGETLDIHAGGEDLIFPHHECEIAQAESLSGKPFARYWVHTRFLLVEGEKMSKSKGNWLTVNDLLKPESEGGQNIDPLALRLALISGYYRKQLNFTFNNLRDSAKIVRRYRETHELVKTRMLDGDVTGKDFIGERLKSNYESVLEAMAGDLNTPEALARALSGLKLINGTVSQMNQIAAQHALEWFEKINALLGFIYLDNGEADSVHGIAPSTESDPLAEKVESLLEERSAARKNKNFERSDAIRDELESMGIEVMDTPDGARWRKRI